MCQEHSRKYLKQELQNFYISQMLAKCTEWDWKAGIVAHGGGTQSPTLLSQATGDSLSRRFPFDSVKSGLWASGSWGGAGGWACTARNAGRLRKSNVSGNG